MSIPVLCYECGEYLGSSFELVKTAIQGFNNQEVIPNTIYDIDKIDNESKPIKHILDAMLITNICCRKSIVGYFNFNQF